MATKPSLGNQLYLYQLLSNELGVGKQTFLPRVEEVLAADDIDPYDLDADSTLELMELLGDFISLTVFKGGRVYATVVRNEEWDALLEKAGDGKADKAKAGGKSWKRAKKSAKPVKPKHKKRPEPEPEPEPVPEPEFEPESASEADLEAEPAAAAEPMANAEIELEPENRPESAVSTESEQDSEAMPETALKPATEPTEPEAVIESKVTIEPEPVNEPAAETGAGIAFTIVYDPDKDAEEVLAATSAEADATLEDLANKDEESAAAEEPSGAPAETTPAAAPAPAGTALPAESARTLPDGYPRDLSTDVYCPADILRELSYLLPYGADVMGIANEYYYIALERGTLETGRSRASFPLRYTANGERTSVTVRLKKRAGTPGLDWAVESIETE